MKNSFKIVNEAPAKAQSPDPMLFEPAFRSRQESLRIQRQQSVVERHKFSDTFNRLGCLRCGTKERPHQGHGLCTACHRWYANELEKSMRLRAKGEFE